MSAADHYAVLGVSPDADRETIRTAYVAIARATHPDRASGDSEARASASRRIREVNAAWNVLSDPVRRRDYDRRRAGSSGDALRATAAAPRTRIVGHRPTASPASAPATDESSWLMWTIVALLLVGVIAVLVVSAYATAGESSTSPSSTTIAPPTVGSCVAITASPSGRIATVVPCSSPNSGLVNTITDTPRPCPTGVAMELADGRTTLCLVAQR